MRATPTTATLGAVVTDVDLAQVDRGTMEDVTSAFHEYAVLVFPAQHLPEPAQVSFSRRFGEL